MGKPPAGKAGDVEGEEGHDAAVANDLKELAHNIERARVAAGMSQTDLAQLCGISQSHISQISPSNPRVESCLKDIGRSVGAKASRCLAIYVTTT